jgi:hypothetical protein
VISLAVSVAGYRGECSPGDYAAFKFPPPPRHDLDTHRKSLIRSRPQATDRQILAHG